MDAVQRGASPLGFWSDRTHWLQDQHPWPRTGQREGRLHQRVSHKRTEGCWKCMSTLGSMELVIRKGHVTCHLSVNGKQKKGERTDGRWWTDRRWWTRDIFEWKYWGSDLHAQVLKSHKENKEIWKQLHFRRVSWKDEVTYLWRLLPCTSLPLDQCLSSTHYAEGAVKRIKWTQV